MTTIHTPTPFGLGVISGLEERGTYENPYDDYLDKYAHQRWSEGYEVGESLRAVVAPEVAAQRER